MTLLGAAHAGDVEGEPLAPGARVSLELPEAGSCVAVVTTVNGSEVLLDLLDEVSDGEIHEGAALELYMARPQGLYHWACAVRSLDGSRGATVELLGQPVFVQRRLGHRVGAALGARVRRVSSARRGKLHEMVVVDISRGGMKLEGDFQLSTGDTLEVTVDLGSPLQVMGRAVMAYPAEDGRWAAHLSFLDGQREAVDTVVSYVASQLGPHVH